MFPLKALFETAETELILQSKSGNHIPPLCPQLWGIEQRKKSRSRLESAKEKAKEHLPF